MSLVSISSSSEILSTVVRYSITLVSRSGRREISKMCSMYDRLSAREKVVGMFTGSKSRKLHPQDILAIGGGLFVMAIDHVVAHPGPACHSSPGS